MVVAHGFESLEMHDLIKCTHRMLCTVDLDRSVCQIQKGKCKNFIMHVQTGAFVHNVCENYTIMLNNILMQSNYMTSEDFGNILGA